MSAGDIYSKTALGVREVSDRKLKVSPRLRTMLILIDGRQPAFVLKEEGQKLGAPEEFIEQLLGLGLIAKTGTVGSLGASSAVDQSFNPVPAVDEYARFCTAKDFMNVSVVNALGLKSFFFTLKIERAGNVADLRELAEAYRAAIAKASGQAEAEVLTERLLEMVG
jgi:hypothetical protein